MKFKSEEHALYLGERAEWIGMALQQDTPYLEREEYAELLRCAGLDDEASQAEAICCYIFENAKAIRRSEKDREAVRQVLVEYHHAADELMALVKALGQTVKALETRVDFLGLDTENDYRRLGLEEADVKAAS